MSQFVCILVSLQVRTAYYILIYSPDVFANL